MKFRFCGDLDAPDWLLGEVSVLSKMSSIRMLLICRQVVDQLLGKGVNYVKIQKLTTSKRIQLDEGDIKAIIAALHFIFRSSAKYNVDENILLDELQQLGLPRDIAKAIHRSYRSAKEKMRRYLSSQTLELPRLDKVEWRVDYLLSSNSLQNINMPSVRMKLHINEDQLKESSQPINPVFEINAEKFRVFYAELKAARSLMDSLS